MPANRKAWNLNPEPSRPPFYLHVPEVSLSNFGHLGIWAPSPRDSKLYGPVHFLCVTMLDPNRCQLCVSPQVVVHTTVCSSNSTTSNAGTICFLANFLNLSAFTSFDIVKVVWLKAQPVLNYWLQRHKAIDPEPQPLFPGFYQIQVFDRQPTTESSKLSTVRQSTWIS